MTNMRRRTTTFLREFGNLPHDYDKGENFASAMFAVLMVVSVIGCAFFLIKATF